MTKNFSGIWYKSAFALAYADLFSQDQNKLRIPHLNSIAPSASYTWDFRDFYKVH